MRSIWKDIQEFINSGYFLNGGSLIFFFCFFVVDTYFFYSQEYRRERMCMREKMQRQQQSVCLTRCLRVYRRLPGSPEPVADHTNDQWPHCWDLSSPLRSYPSLLPGRLHLLLCTPYLENLKDYYTHDLE